MRDLPQRFLDALGTSHKLVNEVTASAPLSSDAVEIPIDAGSFTVSGSGARYSANLTLSPELGGDASALILLPGATFSIRSGIDYGAGQIDWVDCGVYEAVSGNSSITIGEIPLGLQDGTCRQERCTFPAPWTAAAGSRAAAISAMVTDASPAVTVTILADGGTMPTAVYDRDRLAAERQIATDGVLDIGFDAVGGYVIQGQPVMTPAAPVWTARTGVVGNIVDADRNLALGRLFNTVVVVPVDETQTWPVQVISVSDPAHPRHSNKIGVVPFRMSAMSATTAAQALAAGTATLQKVLKSTEHINVTVLGNPGLEYGDTIAIAHQKTEVDPGYFRNALIDELTFDLVTGRQQITGRDTDLAEVEES